MGVSRLNCKREQPVMKCGQLAAIAAVFVTLSPLSSASGQAEAVADKNAAGVAFFEAKIRPVLVEKCYSCHSNDADELKAGLHLDSRDGILQGRRLGASRGPRQSGRQPDHSSAAITTATRCRRRASCRRPSSPTFEHWIEMGMPDPRDGAAAGGQVAASISRRAGSSGRSSRSQAREPPQVKNADWPIRRHRSLSAREAGGARARARRPTPIAPRGCGA